MTRFSSSTDMEKDLKGFDWSSSQQPSTMILTMPWLIQDKPTLEEELFFVHVPRCGGTSLMHHFEVPTKCLQGRSPSGRFGIQVLLHRYKLLEGAIFPIFTFGNGLVLMLFGLSLWGLTTVTITRDKTKWSNSIGRVAETEPSRSVEPKRRASESSRSSPQPTAATRHSDHPPRNSEQALIRHSVERRRRLQQRKDSE
jgi:hypothetical protein